MAFIEITNLDMGILNDVFVTHGMTVKKLVTGENVIINLTSSNDDGAVNALNVSVSGLTGINKAEQTTKQTEQNMLMNDDGVRNLIATIIEFYQSLGFNKKQSVLMATNTLSFVFEEAEKYNSETYPNKLSEIRNKLKSHNRCLNNNNLDDSI